MAIWVKPAPNPAFSRPHDGEAGVRGRRRAQHGEHAGLGSDRKRSGQQIS
jgi:hypothetical protein